MSIVPFAIFAGDSGAPVLFLHGVGGNAELWRPQLDALKATHRCIAWNMPGYGRTTSPLPQMTFPALAEAAGRLLDRCGVAAAHVVGHSMGGMVALEFAASYPQRVSSLVLSGSSAAFGKSDGAWQAEFLAQRLKPLDEGRGMKGITEQVVDSLLGNRPDKAARAALVASMLAIPETVYRAALHCLVTFDRRDALAGLKMPVLLIAGQKDRIAPPELMRRMAERISGAGFVEIPDVGHLANIERPDAFNAALIPFLTGLQKAAA
jgi:3-oxoadipate enol-lactonase